MSKIQEESCSHKRKQYCWFSTDEINPKDSRPVHFWKCSDCGKSKNVSKEEFMKKHNYPQQG